MPWFFLRRVAIWLKSMIPPVFPAINETYIIHVRVDVFRKSKANPADD
jgi:hypothetical protein